MGIKGIHAMFYTTAPQDMRAFLRDKLDLPYTDTGEGWLIFKVPAVEIGCHASEHDHHEFSFFCDDLHKTVAELEARGVEFTQEIQNQEWGLVTRMRLPDGHEVELYQPKYSMG